MKLRWLFTTSHLLAMCLGGLVFWQMAPSESGAWTGTLAIVAGLAMAIGSGVALLLLQGLREIEAAAASDVDAPAKKSMLIEFDQCIERVRTVVQRWSHTAANSRQQMLQVEQLLELLDRRMDHATSDHSGPAVEQLRRLLVSLSGMADADLEQILTYTGEVERATQEIAAHAEDQSEAVSRTTTYVEQMSLQFDSVAEHANAAQHAAEEARETAASAQQSIQELSRSIDGVRLRVQSAERRLKSLGERSQEISSIVGTIGSISSRTDLLALNASIESFRAGEQGRGFSIVAEEVRNLAEQAALATREVSSLIEAIQSETQESIQSMAEQRTEVDAEIDRIKDTARQLSRIATVCDASYGRVGEITKLAGHQLHLTQELVTAVERISDAARQNRSRAEGVGWTMKTVSKLTHKLDSTLEPLRGCGPERSDRQRTAARSAAVTSSHDTGKQNSASRNGRHETSDDAIPVGAGVGSDLHT